MRWLQNVSAGLTAVWLTGCMSVGVGEHLEPSHDGGCTFTPIAIPFTHGSGGFERPGQAIVVHNNTAWGVRGVPDYRGLGLTTGYRPTSTVWRTDLSTGTITYSKSLGEPVNSVAFAEGRIWATTQSSWVTGPKVTVKVLDPGTLAEEDSFSSTNRMLTAGGHIFECRDEPPALLPIDAVTHRPTEPILLDPEFGEIGAICQGSSGDVFVLGWYSGLLARVNVPARRVEAMSQVAERLPRATSNWYWHGPWPGRYDGLMHEDGSVEVWSTRREEEQIVLCSPVSCEALARSRHPIAGFRDMVAFDGSLWTIRFNPEDGPTIVGRTLGSVRNDQLELRLIRPPFDGSLISGDGRMWLFGRNQLCRMDFGSR